MERDLQKQLSHGELLEQLTQRIIKLEATCGAFLITLEIIQEILLEQGISREHIKELVEKKSEELKRTKGKYQ